MQENVWNKLCENTCRVFRRFQVRHEEAFQLDVSATDQLQHIHAVSPRWLMIGDAHLTSQWSGGVKLLRPSRSYSNINRLCADVNVTSQLAVSLAIFVNTLQAVTLNTQNRWECYVSFCLLMLPFHTSLKTKLLSMLLIGTSDVSGTGLFFSYNSTSSNILSWMQHQNQYNFIVVWLQKHHVLTISRD